MEEVFTRKREEEYEFDENCCWQGRQKTYYYKICPQPIGEYYAIVKTPYNKVELVTKERLEVWLRLYADFELVEEFPECSSMR